MRIKTTFLLILFKTCWCPKNNTVVNEISCIRKRTPWRQTKIFDKNRNLQRFSEFLKRQQIYLQKNNFLWWKFRVTILTLTNHKILCEVHEKWHVDFYGQPRKSWDIEPIQCSMYAKSCKRWESAVHVFTTWFLFCFVFFQ